MSHTQAESGGTEARRPLASRKIRFFQALAFRLAGMGMTPNGISVAGMVFALVAAGFFMVAALFGEATFRVLVIAGALFVQLRLICNLLDGLVAVECGKATATGGFFNEAPDRFADVVILLGFGLMAQDAVAGLAAALAAVCVAYMRVLGAEQGAGHCFAGPMAKPHRMALLTAAAVLLGVLGREALMWLVPGVLWVVVAGCGITVLRRLVYIFEKLNAGASAK